VVPRGAEGSPQGQKELPGQAGKAYPVSFNLSKYLFHDQWGEHGILGEQGLYF